ncbi:hypothetical protein BYT27DRAFT_7227519 [Phlegmacium glaucopus]|nr:hypothetical protein BYT27DRAFT_7227519 [Phlegmacium glaucopus]
MTELNRYPSPPGSQSKKRRIAGACDLCKRKKGDSGAMPGNRCSNCVQFGFECTHREVTKALGPAKSYVESLESRLERMDKLLSKLLPGIDINQEVDRIDSDDHSESGIHPPNDEDVHEMLVKHISRLELNPQENRFFGESSGYQLIQTALDLKQAYTGDPISFTKTAKRPEFWHIPEWATKNPELEEHPAYIYPDADLMPSLIDAYFVQFNPYLPLLHRPTFEKSVAEGLHLTDTGFGATLLLVCAHGSRYSDDPRVLADGSDTLRSAGWKWFEQVNAYRTSLYNRTSLYELQMHALHILFLQSSEIPDGVWAQVGLALRLSQDVGVHRLRRKKDVPPSAEDELWKRAFWVLLSLDRTISSHSGRSCCLNDEDFDLDLPLECDDEYWDNNFQQPPGIPSSIMFFNSFLRLMDILAYTLRLIYPIRRPNNKIMTFPPRSEQQIISQLDSAMNNWMDKVPCHLRWNPNCENTLFLKQSAALHATYYQLQIFIHRPFIPSPRNPFPATFPSLAICTNAARSCSHVLEAFARRSFFPLASLQMTAFTAAVILLLNMWSGRRSGMAPNPRREMQGVQRCMEVLEVAESKWASAGRYRDVLIELANAGELPIVDNNPSPDPPKKKRPRDSDPSDISPQASPDPSRRIAGTRRVSTSVPPPYVPQQQPPPHFSLPMYSNELGRLPIYGQFKFSDSVPYTPVQASDNVINLSPCPVGPSPDIHGAYATIASNEGRVMENQVVVNQVDNNQVPVTSPNFPVFPAGGVYDNDYLSYFDPNLGMDNATMAVWSAAPTNLEIQDWNSYIYSFEQMTQAQEHIPTHG